MVKHTQTIRRQIASKRVEKLQDVMHEDINNGVYIVTDDRTMEDLKRIYKYHLRHPRV